MRWAKLCEVTVAEPARAFGFRTLATSRSPSSTEWRYDLVPSEDGTQVSESYRIIKAPPRPLLMVIALLAPHHFDMTADLRASLDRLAQLLGDRSAT